uniref:MHC class I-like antigen recognition-like domain-containing protein n=1 Tax=Electrophorus electricus TaxID=8005 RepID=A0A4W4E056_ELEEL
QVQLSVNQIKCLHVGGLSFTCSHSLQYFYTAVTPGINFPEFTIVGLVDEEQFVYYDNIIRKMIPKSEWIKKSEGADYWNTETQKQEGAQETFKVSISNIMGRFNQTNGENKHTQYMND